MTKLDETHSTLSFFLSHEYKMRQPMHPPPLVRSKLRARAHARATRAHTPFWEPPAQAPLYITTRST
eukprot:2083259-Lingulodinium_polyedra.AAC.1